MPSLIDPQGRPHTYLRISVTDRCNLRCIYCRPQAEEYLKPREEILSLEEILRVAGLCVASGVEKIRLTGGEPLVRKNLEWLVQQLKSLDGLRTIGLTTNGSLLNGRAQSLRVSGLDSINVSVDSLRPERFQEITLRNLFEDLMAGIQAALEAGFTPLKINVVVMRGINDDELLDFVNLTRSQPIHVRFIEFMPFRGNRWLTGTSIPYAEMLQIISDAYPLQPVPPPSPQATAKDFRVDGYCGLVSFITPLTDNFCAKCNRIRLTADGSIKSCLFYPPETNLRFALRNGASDNELMSMIQASLSQKHPAHPPEGELRATDLHCMTGIGG